MADLAGKVALVTGASRGIGASIARRLAHDGCDVVITYLEREDAAQCVVADILTLGRKALALRADAADPRTMAPTVERVQEVFGKLDILVNNAGFMDSRGTALADIPLDIVDRTLMVNARGAFLFAQAAAALLPRGGRIINIGSCLGSRVPAAGLTLYAMSKAAIHGMTRGLARDLAPRGITVNQISPGPIDTDMSPADGPNASFFCGLTALGRFGTPVEVAAVASFLASNEASFVTGADVAVDGGVVA